MINTETWMDAGFQERLMYSKGIVVERKMLLRLIFLYYVLDKISSVLCMAQQSILNERIKM